MLATYLAGDWGKGVANAKRKYIEAAYELLERDGVEGVSIRKVAERVGCSSAALYRHFPDISKLTAVASIRFLRDYFEDARVLSKVELNPLELNLQLWECLAFYSFRDAGVYENLFFGSDAGALYPEAVKEYMELYPEDLEGLKGFMYEMFTDATIEDRDGILLGRAVENGMLSEKSAEYLCKVDSYLYRGVLAAARGRDLDEEGFRELTREFMQMIIHSYTTQLEEGYSILVVSPDFVAGDQSWKLGARESYRVKIVALSNDHVKKEEGRATA